jgi:superfamily II DNA or RNA helicase
MNPILKVAQKNQTFLQTTIDFNKVSKVTPIYVEPILSTQERLKLQRQVNLSEINIASLDCIKSTCPYLLDHQHEDVMKAEKWLYEKGNKAILFTNGTGSGKTICAAGIAFRRQQANILIITPSDKKSKDWIEELSLLSIRVYQLEGIKDAGKIINVTTYANFRQNQRVKERPWDLVFYDECHNIMSNEKGEPTYCLEAHRQATKNEQTKVVFLSATPFSYVKNLEYADGYLFNMGSDKRYVDDLPSDKEQFYIDNFGYRFEKNKLLEPDVGTDVSKMERDFADRLMSSGAMSTRKISLPYDYERKFILL